MLHEAFGWAATAVFLMSYFFTEAAALRKIQAVAAILWLLYGVTIHSLPVIASNAMVAAVAIYTSVFRFRSQAKSPTSSGSAR